MLKIYQKIIAVLLFLLLLFLIANNDGTLYAKQYTMEMNINHQTPKNIKQQTFR